MKTAIRTGLFFLLLSSLACSNENSDLYISPEGNDQNKGTKLSPFASIERAAEEVKMLKTDGNFPSSGLNVWLREGEYLIKESISMTEEHSGLPGAPVLYQAFPGEKVVLSGSNQIPMDAAEKVSKTGLLERIIDQEAASRLLQIDLASLGIKDYGINQTRGGGSKSLSRDSRPPDFMIDGKKLILARWPNLGESVEMDKIIDPGVDRNGRSGRGESDASSGSFVKDDPRGGTFSYSFSRPELWKQEKVFVSGVLSETWVWSYVGVDINNEKKEIKLKTPITYGLINRPEKNYFHFEDVPEEIDQPGEYWLDREKGILYFLPPEDYKADSEIRMSMLKTPMIISENASWLTFLNIIFDGSRDVCMEISGGEDVNIDHCEIRNFLMSAINIDGGKSHTINSCHIHNIGSNVITVDGGDWETLTPSGFEIKNNHIHTFGYYIPSSNVAINLRGVGVRVTHNLIHDAPHKLISFKGNDHIIMFNEFHDAVRDFFDAGAINCHLGYDPTQRGTVISSNYFHEIGMKMEGCKCIYTDGASFEVTIEKNIFQNIGTDEVQNNAINNNTGSHIHMRNNIFLNCTMPLKNYFYLSQANSLRFNMYREDWKDIFSKYDFSEMPHGKKYPALLRFWEEEHELPTTNSFVNNLIYNTEVELLNGEYIMTVRNQGIPIEELVEISGNKVFDSDPGFVDYSAGNLNLKPDAEVFKEIPGFEEIPFSKIGLMAPVGPEGLSSGDN
ncbi:right-handed parallel beta-helix repeat-containing protein [Bacteroidota bacterium]